VRGDNVAPKSFWTSRFLGALKRSLRNVLAATNFLPGGWCRLGNRVTRQQRPPPRCECLPAGQRETRFLPRRPPCPPWDNLLNSPAGRIVGAAGVVTAHRRRTDQWGTMGALTSQVSRQRGHSRFQLEHRYGAVLCVAPQLWDHSAKRAWNSSEMKAGATGPPWHHRMEKDLAVQMSAAMRGG